MARLCQSSNFGSSFGPSARYASSCEALGTTLGLLQQFDQAIEVSKKCLKIRMKLYGPKSRPCEVTRFMITQFMKESASMKKKNLKLELMCSVVDCGIFGKDMTQCPFCALFFMCSKHTIEISNHNPQCPKHPDFLIGDIRVKEGEKRIVKCRQCRGEGKLKRCAKCEQVYYCGTACQNADWKRHKLFCGKKEHLIRKE